MSPQLGFLVGRGITLSISEGLPACPHTSEGSCLLTQDAEDEVQLLLHCGAWEEGPACGHLVEYAAHAPGQGGHSE